MGARASIRYAASQRGGIMRLRKTFSVALGLPAVVALVAGCSGVSAQQPPNSAHGSPPTAAHSSTATASHQSALASNASASPPGGLLPAITGSVTNTRYGFVVPLPKGWTVKAADGVPVAVSAQLVLAPPSGASRDQPVTVTVNLNGVEPNKPSLPFHLTQSRVHMGGCDAFYSAAVPTGAAAASHPALLAAECYRDGYDYWVTESVAPGQALPSPLFSAIIERWQWSTPAPPGDQGFVLSSTHMVTATTGWGVRRTGPNRQPSSLWRTTDGGSHWSNVSPADLVAGQHLVGADFLDGTHAWVAFVSPDQRGSTTAVSVLRTSDGGSAWQSATLTVPFPPENAFPVSLSFSGAQDGWLLAHPLAGMSSSPGWLYVTADGGVTWRLVAPVTGESNGVPGAPPPVTKGLPLGGPVLLQGRGSGWLTGSYASTAPAYLFHSTDGGATWSPVSLSPPKGLKARVSVSGTPTLFPGTSFGYLTALAHNVNVTETLVYVTHDGGHMWTPLHLPGYALTPQVSFVADGDGWMWIPNPDPTGSSSLMGGALYATTNGGTTWHALPLDSYVTNMMEVGGNITSLDFTTDQDGWALMQLPGESDDGRLLWTTDGGEHWSPVGGAGAAVAVSSRRSSGAPT